MFLKGNIFVNDISRVETSKFRLWRDGHSGRFGNVASRIHLYPGYAPSKRGRATNYTDTDSASTIQSRPLFLYTHVLIALGPSQPALLVLLYLYGGYTREALASAPRKTFEHDLSLSLSLVANEDQRGKAMRRVFGVWPWY